MIILQTFFHVRPFFQKRATGKVILYTVTDKNSAEKRRKCI